MVTPSSFISALVSAIVLGIVTGFILHREREDAIFWSCTVAIFGLVSAVSKGFFFKDIDDAFWARLFTWGVSCYTVLWGTQLRRRLRRALEIHAPATLLNPILKKL